MASYLLKRLNGLLAMYSVYRVVASTLKDSYLLKRIGISTVTFVTVGCIDL